MNNTTTANRITPLLPFGIILLAFILRLSGLDARPLWFDESIEYWMATVPLTKIHQAVAGSTHDPPLYSYILRQWQLLGIQEFWLRLPSFYTSLIGIAAIIRIGKQLGTPTTAIIPGLLMAIGATDIRYAQEVGQYAPLVCILALNLLLLYRTQQKPGWQPWLLWGVTALISLYTHYGAAITILATAVPFLLHNLWRRDWLAVKQQILVGLGTILLTLPLILIIIPQQLSRLGTGFQALSQNPFFQTSMQIILFQWLANFWVVAWPWPSLPPWVIWLTVVIAFIFALIKARSVTDPIILLLITWVTYYLIGRTGAYFFAGTRHSLLLTPLFVLGFATGVVALGRLNKYAAAVLISIIALGTLFVPQEGAEDLRTITHHWLAERQPQEATFVYYGAAPGFQYQRDLANKQASALPHHWYGDCWQGTSAAYCQQDQVYFGEWTRGLTAAERKQRLMTLVGTQPDRLWLVFSHMQPQDDATLLKELEAEYTVETAKLAESAALFLLEKR